MEADDAPRRIPVTTTQKSEATIMSYRSFLHNPTPEDRVTQAKWARGFAVVYGTILLLLLAVVVTSRIASEPSRSSGTASARSTNVQPTTAISSSAAPQPMKPYVARQ
jgi:hypothetical protein